ncbi:hypothetical protein ACEQ8H_005502 [Pleosporales sp. CAS-2024a]
MSPNQNEMYSVSTVLVALATVIMVARLRVRLSQKANNQMDDWTACAGLVVLWSIAGVIIAGTAKGAFGKHTLQDPETGESMISQSDLDDIEYMWIVLILGVLSIGFVKLSVIFLYRRIFTISRMFNVYSMILIVLVVVWTLGFLAANIFMCGTHPSAAWTSHALLLKYCYDSSPATTVRMLTNVIMDLLIVLSPMPIVWRMRMSVTQKVQVTGIFALGFLAIAAGTVRAYFQLLDTLGPNTIGYRDLQGQNTTMVAWTLIEIVAALVACCLPTLRPLVANTACGTFFTSVFSAMFLRSRTSGSSRRDECDAKLAEVTIGGSERKTPHVDEEEKENSESPVLRDVGNLV